MSLEARASRARLKHFAAVCDPLGYKPEQRPGPPDRDEASVLSVLSVLAFDRASCRLGTMKPGLLMAFQHDGPETKP